jgi:CubicO group peptidase (beta-lactamase class C family)
LPDGELDDAVDEAIARFRGPAGLVIGALAGSQEGIRARGGVAPDALFEIGSVTKVFTAILLADLSLAGTVALDEPLQALLPGVRVPVRDGEITLAHLATHSSGLPRLPPGFVRRARRQRANPYAWLTEEDVLAALERTRLRARPGTKVRYSNYGYGLLGLALSRRAGSPYVELLERRVLSPLGLHETGVDVPAGRLAGGHSRRGKPVSHWEGGAFAGAGALRSSGADLLRFARACLDPPVGSPGPALALTLRSRRRLNRFSEIGLGWFLRRWKDGSTLAWHNGGTGGFRSVFGVLPERGIAVVALANSARSPDRTAVRLARRLARA